VRSDVTQYLKSTLIYLGGEEDLLRRAALEALVEAGAAGDDFDLETMNGDSSQPTEWMASAGTAPFLSPRRTVVVRNVLRNDQYDQLAGFKLPETALLILVADEEAGDESKQRRFERMGTEWVKAVKAAGGHVAELKADAKGLRNLIKAEATERGKKINDRALDTLIEMTGGSLTRSVEELEKLVIFVGEEDQIREQDVKELVVPSREWNIFRMTDAIMAGNVGGGLAQLRVLLSSTSKPEDFAFRNILPSLSRQLRLLWQARVLHDHRVSDPTAAPERLRQLFPGKPNIITERDFVRNKIMGAARSLSYDQIAQCMEAVSRTDASLKGMFPSYSASETLERLVLEMAAIVKPKPVTA
jgi:DNA polymerase III subunit delta